MKKYIKVRGSSQILQLLLFFSFSAQTGYCSKDVTIIWRLKPEDWKVLIMNIIHATWKHSENSIKSSRA